MSRENRKKLVSEEWMYVDKTKQEARSESTSSSDSCQENIAFEKLHISKVLSRLRPFVPLSVEETLLTTSLENWTNRNVRLIGIIKLDGGNYWLQSFKEDGVFQILLDLKHCTKAPLVNERVQVFGTMNINETNCKPYVDVELFRNMESGDLCQYIEALTRMSKFVPRFIPMYSNSRIANSSDSDS